MKTTKLTRLTILAFGAALSPPAVAQLEGTKPFPVGYDTKAVDPVRDPWRPLTKAENDRRLPSGSRKKSRRVSITVDYNADGIPDTATMMVNRSQIGVVVRFGGGKGTVLAYRARGPWRDQYLDRAGKRVVSVVFPESTIVHLSSESGLPMVYYSDDGG